MKKVVMFSIGALTCAGFPLKNSQLFPPDPHTGVYQLMERCENSEVVCYMLHHFSDVKLSCFPKDHIQYMTPESSDSLAKKWQKK